MKPLTYMLARYYQARSQRAYRAYLSMKKKPEKYFAKVGL